MVRVARVACCILSGFLALVILCCLRTAVLSASRQKAPEACGRNESRGYISSDEAWLRFKQALQYQTVSVAADDYNKEELKKFQNFLIESK